MNKYLIFKRAFDIFFSFVGLLFLIPLFLVVSLAIRIDSKGRAIFKQVRVGKDCKKFNIIKFRTMAINAEGVNEVTKLGKFLRKTSIDELPQLINVLIGEMSFIGPRPWIEEYTNYFTETEKRRSEVLPGLSGWAQVKGRNGISIQEKLELDIWYVDNISFKTDLTILFKTIQIVLKKTNTSITENGIKNELDELKKCYYTKTNNNKVKMELKEKTNEN